MFWGLWFSGEWLIVYCQKSTGDRNMYLASSSAETLLLGGPQFDFVSRVAVVSQSIPCAFGVVLATHHLPIGSCLWKCSELENEV